MHRLVRPTTKVLATRARIRVVKGKKPVDRKIDEPDHTHEVVAVAVVEAKAIKEEIILGR